MRHKFKNEEKKEIKLRHALIVEDEADFQFALADAISKTTGTWRISSFFNAKDAISFTASAREKFDIALVDIGLPDRSGLEVIREIRKKFVDVPILVVSIISSEQAVIKAFSNGTNGYILKDDQAMEMAASITETLRGNNPITPSLARFLVQRFKTEISNVNPQVGNLSKREYELLQHISFGLSYIEAAYEMKLKVSTVHSYSKSIFRKLNSQSKTQALAAAKKNGLIG